MIQTKATDERLRGLQEKLRLIAEYPPPGHDRRTEDGYPAEFDYDIFAYKRMVDCYREAIAEAIEESEETTDGEPDDS